ncbi:LLM class flavin-dependent oxidoreductase [Streptosporangium sp. NPDC051022]|uniref:LLM class flavin-dependent oxidoreductase n=1 Tax=Streptosporangium sp. NPDC051022 TaxID=3155752 RepID=UPI0034259092
MELATSVFVPGAPFAQVVEIAVRADRLGLDCVWIPDEGTHAHDPWVLLGAVAAATGRIGLGLGPTNPYSRHPLITANALRGAAEHTGGRARICLAAGGTLALGPLGLAPERPVARTRETIAAIRDTCPGTEIWVAAKGPRMLDLAAAEADGVMLAGFPTADLAGVADRLRARRPGVRICYRPQLAMDERSYRRQQVELGYALPDSPPALLERLGVDRAYADRLRRAGPEAAADLVPAELVAAFSFVGTPEQCARRLTELAEAIRLDQLIIPGLGAEPGHDLARILLTSSPA